MEPARRQREGTRGHGEVAGTHRKLHPSGPKMLSGGSAFQQCFLSVSRLRSSGFREAFFVFFLSLCLMVAGCINVPLYFYRDRKLYKLGLKGFYVKDDNGSTGKVTQCTACCVPRYYVICVWLFRVR